MSNVILPQPLVVACRKLQDLRLAMGADLDVRKARQKVMDTTHLLQSAQNILDGCEDPYNEQIKELKDYISGHALEVGQTFESGGIKVKHRKGYTSRTLPSKALKDIEKKRPDLWTMLQPYLSEKTVDGKVTVL